MKGAADLLRLRRRRTNTHVALIVVRHGRTELNATGQLRGHLDPPLDEAGRAEVSALAHRLSEFRPVRVVTSPLRRAVETAIPICDSANASLVVDTRLIDRDYGRWSGQTPAQVAAHWGSVDAAPGVEPTGEVVARAQAALDDQVPLLEAGVVVLVAHDAVNRLLLNQLDEGLGEPDAIEQHTACWNGLARDSTGWRVLRVDEHP